MYRSNVLCRGESQPTSPSFLWGHHNPVFLTLMLMLLSKTEIFLFYRGIEKNWIKEILLNLVRLKQNEQYCLVVPNIHGVLSAEKIPNIHFSPDKLKGFVGGSWFSFCLVRMILFLKVIRHFDDLLVWPFVKYKSPRTYKMWIWQVSKWDREQAARGLQSLLVLLHISG